MALEKWYSGLCGQPMLQGSGTLVWSCPRLDLTEIILLLSDVLVTMQKRSCSTRQITSVFCLGGLGHLVPNTSI